MPGTATLDSDVLVDDLLTDVVDGLRAELHPAFGVRAFRVFTVARAWSGGQVGRGDPTDTVVELDPQPLVHSFAGLMRTQEPCGFDIAGAVKLTEVSLTYTQAELLACEAPAGTEYLIRIDEAHGQAQASKYFTHAKPPYPDRIQDIGWVLWLELVEDEC